jgi:eukaryotic-like serine/threonine-protein kinase
MANNQDDESVKLASLKYLVSSVLGTSGNSTVALITAKEAGGGRYALRILKREEDADDVAIEMARAEHQASAKVNHPAILKVLDFRTRKTFFRVTRAEQLMEYVLDAKTLDSWEKFPIGPAVLVFHQAAAALAHMHRRGVGHGTLDPTQLMLSRTGQVKMRGYGLTQVERSFRDKIKVSSSFAAPEQIKEKVVDAKTDIYALGATMYRLLTGQPPTGGAAVGRNEPKKISTPVALNPKVPVPLNNILVNCLQSDPHKRPPDMYELVKQLEAMVKAMHLEESALAGLSVAEH